MEIPHYFNLVIEKKPDSQLIIAGKDMFDVKTNNESTTKMMKDIFTEKALAKTIFIGSVPYNEIKMHIAKATICIFPSYAEALPVSWIEAMALEKAIVASNIGWSNEIIDDEIDGFKVNPKNHQEFANKIIKLLDDDQFRLNLQKNARIKIIQKFSTKVTANKTLEFYNKFIN